MFNSQVWQTKLQTRLLQVAATEVAGNWFAANWFAPSRMQQAEVGSKSQVASGWLRSRLQEHTTRACTCLLQRGCKEAQSAGTMCTMGGWMYHRSTQKSAMGIVPATTHWAQGSPVHVQLSQQPLARLVQHAGGVGPRQLYPLCNAALPFRPLQGSGETITGRVSGRYGNTTACTPSLAANSGVAVRVGVHCCSIT